MACFQAFSNGSGAWGMPGTILTVEKCEHWSGGLAAISEISLEVRYLGCHRPCGADLSSSARVLQINF